jgi:hypothetical protein
VPSVAREPTFLPLTVSASAAAAGPSVPHRARASAQVVQRTAQHANSAAAECWAALLAGCDSPGRKMLPSRLRELSDAAGVYAGSQWWYGEGSHHRRRVAESQARIEDAVVEHDGAEFAEAFISYDQAVATAVVHAHNRLRSAAR